MKNKRNTHKYPLNEAYRKIKGEYPKLNIIILRNKQQYDTYMSKVYTERMKIEHSIAAKGLAEKEWNETGFCIICNKSTEFRINWNNYHINPSLGKMPCFRERMVCTGCGLNNRMRFAADYLIKNIYKMRSDNVHIYLYEQVTPFYHFIKERCDNVNIIGSEYLGNQYKSGEIIHGLRHEDAQELSLDKSSIDIILSNDVFEHIPNIEKALTEAFRILKSTGKLIFTIPFSPTEQKTIKRAEVNDGIITHILPEKYHGNPISENGSLVYYEFGWDIIDMCKQAGFRKSYMLGYYSLTHGHIGNGIQYLFVAEKQKRILFTKFLNLLHFIFR